MWPFDINRRAEVRGRWRGEEERLHEEHPDLQPATVHTLAAVHTLGNCERRRRIRNYFRKKYARELMTTRQRFLDARDHAWGRFEQYTAPDPEVRRILLEIAAMQERSCLQHGIPLSGQARSHYEAIRAILEGDAHHSPWSGPRSDGDLS